MFQSTPLREGRPPFYKGSPISKGFNPRPCVRGDLESDFGLCHIRSFNPRPCVRGDSIMTETIELSEVSIHAPA